MSDPIPEMTQRPKGEGAIWLCSMGLAIGLMMIMGLLGVILYNGLPVFWPQPIVEISIDPKSDTAFRGGKVFAGVAQERRSRREPGKELTVPEEKFYVANRDVYGFSFHYLDERDIAGRSYPQDLFFVRRMEYGAAIGYPLRLESEVQGTIAYGEDGFISALEAELTDVRRRRAEMYRIQRIEMGKISRHISSLDLQAKREGSDQEAIARQRAQLDEEFSKWREKVHLLEKAQDAVALHYRLPSGEEKVMAVGQIDRYYFSNQLSIGQRLNIFVRNVWSFVSENPREANTEGGVFPAIFGTFVMTLLMSLVVTPFGVIAAIYLREYAKQGLLVRSVRIAINNLAGVPSIVFGVFGLAFFVYIVGGGFIDRTFFADRLPTPTFGTGGILWASLTLALMTVPVVIVATEEALSAVPRGMREGSLACGGSQWQTIARIVLPAAVPGIITGVVLAMARGAGEVAPLMLVGVVKVAPNLPVDSFFPFIHLDQKFMHLGFHIYDLGFHSPDSEAAKPMIFATTLLLLLIVVVLNIAAITLRERLRRKYQLGAF